MVYSITHHPHLDNIAKAKKDLAPLFLKSNYCYSHHSAICKFIAVNKISINITLNALENRMNKIFSFHRLTHHPLTNFNVHHIFFPQSQRKAQKSQNDHIVGFKSK